MLIRANKCIHSFEIIYRSIWKRYSMFGMSVYFSYHRRHTTKKVLHFVQTLRNTWYHSQFMVILSWTCLFDIMFPSISSPISVLLFNFSYSTSPILPLLFYLFYFYLSYFYLSYSSSPIPVPLSQYAHNLFIRIRYLAITPIPVRCISYKYINSVYIYFIFIWYLF